MEVVEARAGLRLDHRLRGLVDVRLRHRVRVGHAVDQAADLDDRHALVVERDLVAKPLVEQQRLPRVLLRLELVRPVHRRRIAPVPGDAVHLAADDSGAEQALVDALEGREA